MLVDFFTQRVLNLSASGLGSAPNLQERILANSFRFADEDALQ
jgi:hypothetical protein